MKKRVYLVFGIIQFFSTSLFAQNEPYATDSLWSEAPKIYLSDNYLAWDHFPACTKDLKNILIIHDDYSCCISTQVELLLLNTKNAGTIQQLVLAPSELSPAFSLEENIKIKAKADSILGKQTYFAMIPVDTFSIEKDSKTSQNYFKFRIHQQRLKSTEFVLPKHTFSGYCCTAMPEDTVKCEKTPDTYHIWMDKDRNILLIAYGYNQSADGCEAGPFYMILKIKKS